MIGTALDIGAWLTPADGRTACVVVSVAHLDDEERALVLGVLVATQNPMDLDYRALSNAGLWCVGRQTDADRERVIDGLGGSSAAEGPTRTELANIVKKLAPRWFLMRDAHSRDGVVLLQPRWAMSLMVGPITKGPSDEYSFHLSAANGEKS